MTTDSLLMMNTDEGCECLMTDDYHCERKRYSITSETVYTCNQHVNFTFIGGSLVGVWNGWGYGIAFFRALNFQISEPEIWQKSLFLRNFWDFSANFGL